MWENHSNVSISNSKIVLVIIILQESPSPQEGSSDYDASSRKISKCFSVHITCSSRSNYSFSLSSCNSILVLQKVEEDSWKNCLPIMLASIHTAASKILTGGAYSLGYLKKLGSAKCTHMKIFMHMSGFT